MSVAELFYGAEKSDHKMENVSLIDDFLFTVDIIHSELEILIGPVFLFCFLLFCLLDYSDNTIRIIRRKCPVAQTILIDIFHQSAF